MKEHEIEWVVYAIYCARSMSNTWKEYLIHMDHYVELYMNPNPKMFW